MASALSAITGKAIRVSKIRAGRSKPGLRPQHLAGLELVAQICKGELLGGKVGSQMITLVPHGLLPHAQLTADPGTAGSCTLLAQVTFCPVLILLKGEEAIESTLPISEGLPYSQALPIWLSNVCRYLCTYYFHLTLNSLRLMGYLLTGSPMKCTVTIAKVLFGNDPLPSERSSTLRQIIATAILCQSPQLFLQQLQTAFPNICRKTAWHSDSTNSSSSFGTASKVDVRKELQQYIAYCRLYVTYIYVA